MHPYAAVAIEAGGEPQSVAADQRFANSTAPIINQQLKRMPHPPASTEGRAFLAGLEQLRNRRLYPPVLYKVVQTARLIQGASADFFCSGANAKDQVIAHVEYWGGMAWLQKSSEQHVIAPFQCFTKASKPRDPRE